MPKSEKMACGRGCTRGICDQGGGDAGVWLTHGAMEAWIGMWRCVVGPFGGT